MEQCGRGLRHQIELLEVDRLPWNHRVILQRRLALLAKGIHWRINVFQLTAGGVFDNARPGGIGFAEGNRVGVARAAIAAERLVGHFGHVRSAHHYWNSGGANRIGHAIRLGNHSGHGADADQSNLVVAHKLRDPRFIHRMCVAIHQQHFMARRRERLQQEHPKMRHEIARDTVVGVIQQDFHRN